MLLRRPNVPARWLSVVRSAAIARHGDTRFSNLLLPASSARRLFASTTGRRNSNVDTGHKEAIVNDFNAAFHFPRSTHRINDLAEENFEASRDSITLHGYVGAQRNASARLTFAELTSVDGSHSVQLKLESASPDFESIRERLKLVRPYAPVSVSGILETRKVKAVSNDRPSAGPRRVTRFELNMSNVTPLNDFPKDIIVAEGTTIPIEQRHLQLRTSIEARNAVFFRSKVYETVRSFLCRQHHFTDIETPLLFKSTPEGAHEFLVPTREPGYAYALPQSPQQYKQILMASGIPRYMQIAKCFRDEDLRADRQPEFTQIDMEMAFANQEDVMSVIEDLVKTLWNNLLGEDLWANPFKHITYDEAMSKYGSDKPDTRLGSEILRLDYMLPVDLIQKISDLKEPAVDIFKMSISDDPRETAKFVSSFMDSPESRPFNSNPDGQPGVFIYSARKPLGGLQPFGFEAAEYLEEKLELDEGDLIVVQARPNVPFSGGSTSIGNLRLALHRAAVAQGLISKPEGWNFLWVTSFPLFTPDAEASPLNDFDPAAVQIFPLSSTHHPFTAPLTAQDTELLLTDPLAAKAAHYDLVLNGVELGGGSRRIHHSALQRMVLKDILKLSDDRMQDFEHLLEVLRAGCPPHAGMALGLDRLVMLMLGKESVRDVMAFPKGGGGVDGLVKAPSRVGKETWERYYLQVDEDKKSSK
ncbi:tRNA synthetases class II-domain-containing protein [Elsinoe ampelina]|uniref:tRNA synthetases class II-domain-containing protein n=1 Tax=Elsinoe ampelina TaxID=302913 RepID=A0A6A6GE26_9PEZI|nr:tRNA synthetases class II-domain-containing protein [Elsinoe ampelina]